MNRKSQLPTGIVIDTGYQGMEMFLGSLESAIMELFWECYPNRRTYKSIQRQLRHDQKERALSTVSTTIVKLAQKNLLIRLVGDGNGYGSIAYEYAAVCSREEFVELAIRRALESFKTYFPEELSSILEQDILVDH